MTTRPLTIDYRWDRQKKKKKSCVPVGRWRGGCIHCASSEEQFISRKGSNSATKCDRSHPHLFRRPWRLKLYEIRAARNEDARGTYYERGSHIRTLHDTARHHTYGKHKLHDDGEIGNCKHKFLHNTHAAHTHCSWGKRKLQVYLVRIRFTFVAWTSNVTVCWVRATHENVWCMCIVLVDYPALFVWCAMPILSVLVTLAICDYVARQRRKRLVSCTYFARLGAILGTTKKQCKR